MMNACFLTTMPVKFFVLCQCMRQKVSLGNFNLHVFFFAKLYFHMLNNHLCFLFRELFLHKLCFCYYLMSYFSLNVCSSGTGILLGFVHHIVAGMNDAQEITDLLWPVWLIWLGVFLCTETSPL